MKSAWKVTLRAVHWSQHASYICSAESAAKAEKKAKAQAHKEYGFWLWHLQTLERLGRLI